MKKPINIAELMVKGWPNKADLEGWYPRAVKCTCQGRIEKCQNCAEWDAWMNAR